MYILHLSLLSWPARRLATDAPLRALQVPTTHDGGVFGAVPPLLPFPSVVQVLLLRGPPDVDVLRALLNKGSIRSWYFQLTTRRDGIGTYTSHPMQTHLLDLLVGSFPESPGVLTQL